MSKWRNSQIAKFLAALIVASAATALLRGQAPGTAPQPQEFRGGVDLARIDVSALDGNRRPVRGLTAADFTLRVDGKVQTIRTFAAIEVPASPAPSAARAAWTREVASDVQTNTWSDEGRLVVIYFDRSIPPGPKMATARTIATAAVNELGPNDLAAVTSTRGSAAQNFTSDRTRLLKTIERTTAGSAEGADEAIMNAKVFADDPAALAQFRANETCYCNVCVLEQIQQMADALRGVPQRKMLLFIGSALTMDARDVDAVGGVFSNRAVDGCFYPLKEARTKLLASLERSSVTIHSLDPAGLAPLQGTDASSSLRGRQVTEMNAGMRQVQLAQNNQIRVLPDHTGGRTVTNTNAPQSFVPAVIAETGAYYLIGFDAPKKAVDIQVRSTRRGVNVRTQRMFDPDPPGVMTEDKGAGTVAAPASAVTGVLPARGVPMTTTLLPMAVPGADKPGVLVVTGLEPFQTTAASAASSEARINVFVGIFDPRARPLAENRFSLALTPPSGSDASKHYDVALPLTLEPGTYEIRVGASTAEGRSGSSTSYVDIPDFKKEALSLSGVAVTTVPPDAVVAIDRADQLLPFLPTTRRTFRRSDTIRTFLQIYQGGSDPLASVELAVSILDTQGREMLKANEVVGPERFKTGRTADYGMDTPLSGRAPGEYLLSFGASDGKNKVRRDVRFTVQ